MLIDTAKAEIIEFLGKGSKEEILLKKIAATGLAMLFIYKAGYVAGAALCHLVY